MPFIEEFYENEDITHFRNYYEQSKRYAENIVRKHIENQKLKANIIRLSQVVGDNQSGVTKTHYGIFDFIKKLQKFTTSYPNEAVRIQIDPIATQNMIPINNAIDYLMGVLNKENLPVILNFVSKRPLKNNEIIDSVCSLLPLVIVPKKDLDKESMNKRERMIASGMSFTAVYAKTHLEFDTTNLEKMFSPNGNEISPESLHRMIEYFLKQNLKKGRRKKYFPENSKASTIKYPTLITVSLLYWQCPE